jgi:hypothetical protein
VVCKFDEWREVINAPETYREIAENVREFGASCVGWTDDRRVTHYDVLFAVGPIHGTLQGIHRLAQRDRHLLFVSVFRLGAFAFEIEDIPLHPSYISEKLNISAPEDLATLINGVRAMLANMRAMA